MTIYDADGVRLVHLEPEDKLGHCPECGCTGAMLVGTNNWTNPKLSRSWFRCYNCGTDWRPADDGTGALNDDI
jgi:hypothetical protein